MDDIKISKVEEIEITPESIDKLIKFCVGNYLEAKRDKLPMEKIWLNTLLALKKNSVIHFASIENDKSLLDGLISDFTD